MSPTSYQTAPPREGMIAEAKWFVKRARQTSTAEEINFAKPATAFRLFRASEFFPDERADFPD